MSRPRKHQQPRHDIFTEFPATHTAAMIVRYPHEGGDRIAFCFADAAERLASSFRGGPGDDALLMPFLYLYRHAIELDLKHAIRYAARLRRNNNEQDEKLSPSAVNTRLKDRHKHRLMALVDELDAHLKALEQQPLPADVRRLFTRISSSDPSGESFRYGSGLPEDQDSIDFPSLAAALKQAYSVCSAATDVLYAYEEYQIDMLAEQHALDSEYAAEMRSEFADWA